MTRWFAQEYGIEAIAVAKDLAVDGASEAIYYEVKEKGITIDVLVNNTG